MGSQPTKQEDSNMKRIISGLLVLIMCCGLLTGCGEKEPAKVEVEEKIVGEIGKGLLASSRSLSLFLSLFL